jgi:chromosome segregation ATPase
MGGGVSKKELQDELHVAERAERDEALAVKDKRLRAKDKLVRQLRRQVCELTSAKAASDAALKGAQTREAVAEAAVFAASCTAADKGSRAMQLEEELISANRAGREMESELEALRGEMSRLRSDLEAKSAQLCRTTCSLREAREEIEGGKRMVRSIMEQAEGKVRKIEEMHSNVTFLRAKLVSMYLGEVCEDEHEHGVASRAAMFHAELDPRVRPELCLVKGLHHSKKSFQGFSEIGRGQGEPAQPGPRVQSTLAKSRRQDAWR